MSDFKVTPIPNETAAIAYVVFYMNRANNARVTWPAAAGFREREQAEIFLDKSRNVDPHACLITVSQTDGGKYVV